MVLFWWVSTCSVLGFRVRQRVLDRPVPEVWKWVVELQLNRLQGWKLCCLRQAVMLRSAVRGSADRAPLSQLHRRQQWEGSRSTRNQEP